MKKLTLLLTLLPAMALPQFALHDGDRVVFYGDSITDQRLYTLFTETFVRTRFPKMDVSFVHSGWGGDRVGGGGGGTIDIRLTRDVFPYRPTVVTIMLGMNDAGYRPFDQGLFDTYRNGFEHILDRLRREAPEARLTLIQPSPFDDVTRPVSFPGGYNAVLIRYGEYLKETGTRIRATVADLNTPVVAMLQKANEKDPAAAQKIINDRVHPGEGGHLTMTEALLKAWGAPTVVSAVEIDGGKVVRTDNAKVTGLSSEGGGVSWTQTDGALPYPLNLGDPATQLVVDSSDFVQTLDQQTVKVGGLSGRYALTIDGKPLGTYSADDLGAGVNISTLETPMRAQAWRVFTLVRDRADVHQERWRGLQTHWSLQGEAEATKERDAALKALDRYDAALDKAARKAAQPVAHRFALVPQP